MNLSISAILLAAGESSRFSPLAIDKHKSMYKLLNKPAISFTIEGLKQIGIKDIIIVVKANDKSIQNFFGDGSDINLNIKYVVQNESLGMGNAILSAKDIINTDWFFVLNADQVNSEDLGTKMVEKLIQKKNQDNKIDLVLASQRTETPWNFGILEIDNDMAKSIVEKPIKGTELSNQMVIGIYLLPKKFLETLEEVPTNEYSYEAALDVYIKKYDSTTVQIFEDIPEITLKFPWHIFRLNKYLMDKFLNKQIISEKAVISETAIISGNVIIEDDVRIFEYAVIKGPCYIGKGAIIGNNSLIRDYSYIGEHTIVGFGTEIKHSILYDNVETHKNFIGDSIVDEGTGFGAGTITANRRLDRKNIQCRVKNQLVDTGESFFGNIIGKNVHTGIQVSLMPGVKLGNNSNVGALINITKDVEDNSFIYSKQNIIIKKMK